MGIDWRKAIIGEWSWKRLRRSFLQISFAVYGVLVVVGLFFANGMIFPYSGSSYDRSLPGLKMVESGDGISIATRYWPKAGATHVVLLFHGNYEDIGQLDGIAQSVTPLGFAVLAADYRGYGLSEGRPSESKCYLDGRAVTQLARDLGFDDRQIILWGRSVGSGVATQLATEIDAAGLVLESPFATAFRALTGVPLLPFEKFNNLAKIDEVTEPLFILHGADDTIIAPWHSQKLFDKHRGPKARRVIDRAGHNDLWEQPLDAVLGELGDFFSP